MATIICFFFFVCFFFLKKKKQSFVFYCVIRAQRQSCLVIWYHSQTIWTVGGIVMSHTTYDPIHLLYFVTLARSLIQMIGRSASENTEFCTSKMFINARKMKNSQINFELMTINLFHLPTAHWVNTKSILQSFCSNLRLFSNFGCQAKGDLQQKKIITILCPASAASSHHFHQGRCALWGGEKG